MTQLFLHFWNVPATFKITEKNPYLKWVSSHFLTLTVEVHLVRCGLDASFTFSTTLLITVHTFAVVIISLHIRKYAILFHLAWLTSKNVGFSLSYFIPTKAEQQLQSVVYSLLLRWGLPDLRFATGPNLAQKRAKF